MLAIRRINESVEVIRHACIVLTLPNESWYVKLIVPSYQFVTDTAVLVLCKDGENTDTFLYKVKEKSLWLFSLSQIHTTEHNEAFTVCKLAGHFFLTNRSSCLRQSVSVEATQEAGNAELS
jgi:hypothetical protein